MRSVAETLVASWCGIPGATSASTERTLAKVWGLLWCAAVKDGARSAQTPLCSATHLGRRKGGPTLLISLRILPGLRDGDLGSGMSGETQTGLLLPEARRPPPPPEKNNDGKEMIYMIVSL